MSGAKSRSMGSGQAPLNHLSTVDNAADITNLDGMSVPNDANELAEVYKANMRLVTEGDAQKSVIDGYFPGFNTSRKQAFIVSTRVEKCMASEGWKNGDVLRFRIDPDNNAGSPVTGFNPFYTTITIKGRFRDAAGTGDLAANAAPCNLWELRQFSHVDETTLLGSSIAPSETQPIGETVKDMYYLIPTAN